MALLRAFNFELQKVARDKEKIQLLILIPSKHSHSPLTFRKGERPVFS